MTVYTFATDPFQHQTDYYEAHYAKPAFACWWEQGTGKSKAHIDNAGLLHADGAVNGSLLVAPNGLHRNFITRELPKHYGDYDPKRAFFWRTDKSGTEWHKQEARDFLRRSGMLWLGMSYDAFMTDLGRKLARAFLENQRTFYGLDEAGRIKNPDAQRTKIIHKSAPLAAFKRIYTGTPVSNAPWDVHSQIRFIDDDFWTPHGLTSVESMKTAFGEWEVGRRRVPLGQAMLKHGRCIACVNNAPRRRDKVTGNYVHDLPDGGVSPCLKLKKSRKGIGDLNYGYVVAPGTAFQEFPQQQRDWQNRPRYKNLGQLREILAPIRSRVLKSDVFDLPPKLYTTVDFEMSPKQQACYESMQKMGFATLENGATCSASMALVVMLRLQQIACGYLVADLRPDMDPNAEPEVHPFEPNPRVDMLVEIVQDLDHPALIWARYKKDVDQIGAMLTNLGLAWGRYDGAVSDDVCAQTDDDFHAGRIQFIVGTQSKGGEGRTLVEARTAIFYSNSFKLTERLQAEDRPHRYGQEHPVNNIDLCARGTIDEALIDSFLAKADVAGQVTGDGFREWIKRGGTLL